MGRGATKAQGNVWYQARLEAAKGNERLFSRFGAAEEMGLSEDAVKSAELGLYKCMPVENAVLMADCYNAPELKNYYCLNECPIGCNRPISAKDVGIDRVTVKLLSLLEPEDIRWLRSKLLVVAGDGTITKDEIPAVNELFDRLDDIETAISELRIVGEKAKKGCEQDG